MKDLTLQKFIKTWGEQQQALGSPKQYLSMSYKYMWTIHDNFSKLDRAGPNFLCAVQFLVGLGMNKGPDCS